MIDSDPSAEAINDTLAVVGGGQMAQAFVGGVIDSGLIPGRAVTVVDPDDTAQDWWRTNRPDVQLADLVPALQSSSVVLLAVKPHIVEKVCREAQVALSNQLIISIAAGVSIESLVDWVGHGRVIRVMPNTPSLVGAGASGFCGGPAATDRDKSVTFAILSSIGFTAPVTEAQLDAVTGLSGSGPAYVFMIIEGLADGGVAEGLPRPLAMRLATQTVLGAAKMALESGRHPGELKDAVASPGGTTIAAIATLEQNGLRAAMMAAVAASAKRSREMG